MGPRVASSLTSEHWAASGGGAGDTDFQGRRTDLGSSPHWSLSSCCCCTPSAHTFIIRPHRAGPPLRGPHRHSAPLHGPAWLYLPGMTPCCVPWLVLTTGTNSIVTYPQGGHQEPGIPSEKRLPVASCTILQWSGSPLPSPLLLCHKHLVLNQT